MTYNISLKLEHEVKFFPPEIIQSYIFLIDRIKFLK